MEVPSDQLKALIAQMEELPAPERLNALLARIEQALPNAGDESAVETLRQLITRVNAIMAQDYTKDADALLKQLDTADDSFTVLGKQLVEELEMTDKVDATLLGWMTEIHGYNVSRLGKDLVLALYTKEYPIREEWAVCAAKLLEGWQLGKRLDDNVHELTKPGVEGKRIFKVSIDSENEVICSRIAAELKIGPQVYGTVRCGKLSDMNVDYLVLQHLSGPVLRDLYFTSAMDPVYLKQALTLYYNLIVEGKYDQNDFHAGNVILNGNRVYLIDFGIAQPVDPEMDAHQLYALLYDAASLLLASLVTHGKNVVKADKKTLTAHWLRATMVLREWLLATFPGEVAPKTFNLHAYLFEDEPYDLKDPAVLAYLEEIPERVPIPDEDKTCTTELLTDYVVGAFLAAGGMGEIYALDRKGDPGKHILKVTSKSKAEWKAHGYLTEGELGERAGKLGVGPRVYGFVSCHAPYDRYNEYIVMDRLTGPTLDQVTPTAAYIQRALGLYYVLYTRERILHYDLKGSNLMFHITPEETQLYLIDYGMAAYYPDESEDAIKESMYEAAGALVSSLTTNMKGYELKDTWSLLDPKTRTLLWLELVTAAEGWLNETFGGNHIINEGETDRLDITLPAYQARLKMYA
ncbi:Hypothetical protein POVN_LOCUS73 [uncultured virus]|nr:Hypothetical protein POVN_LOCUS73 [uncultured virus]